MSRRTAVICILGIVITSITACNIHTEQTTSEAITIPTAAARTVIVTRAPSSTPTSGFESVITPLESKTRAVTATSTATNQRTAIPSSTKLPVSTLAPLPVETPDVSNETVVPTPSPFTSLLIDYFQADVEVTDPGQTITLSWGTSNALTVTLWHLAATGQFSEFWTVHGSGEFPYQVKTHERNQTSFALSAVDADGYSEMVTVAVRLRCQDEWYFANHPDICPANPVISSSAAEQHFEYGTMLWIGEEDRIYVLFADSRQYAWQAYTDTWTAGEPDRNPDISAPDGFYQPVRGFGKIWREQPEVRDRLGWATGEEMAFESMVQRTSYAKYNETYIKAVDGLIWRLKAERSGWEKMPADVYS